MVLVFGTVCLDRLHQVPTLPAKGGYVEITRTTPHVGGEALNTATALQKWGAPLRLVSNSLGKGPETELLQNLIHQAQAPAPVAPDLDHPCPVCDIYITPDGERTMFGTGFAQMPDRCDLRLLQTPENPPPKNQTTWFTADANPGHSSVQAAQIAETLGARRYLMDVALSPAQTRPTDIFQTSTDLAGVKGDIQANLRHLQLKTQTNPAFHILSDGANGFVAGGAGHPVAHFPPLPAPAVVDSTGAGDCFRAGALFALHAGLPLPEALLHAAAAGSLNTRAVGATDGIPTIPEIQALLAAHPQVRETYHRQLQIK